MHADSSASLRHRDGKHTGMLANNSGHSVSCFRFNGPHPHPHLRGGEQRATDDQESAPNMGGSSRLPGSKGIR